MNEARSLICSSEPNVEFVMQCLLGIRDLETSLYFSLLEKPGSPTDLSERLGKSRSLIQRGLQNLVGYGLAHRTVVKKARGRAYEYHPVPKETAKEQLKKAVNEWTKAVNDAIDKWD